MISFRRILFPVDFSERCAAVAPCVEAMVRRFGAELTVLHVVDLPPAAGIAPPEAAAWATLIGADQLRQSGKAALEHFVARQFSVGIDLKAETAEGSPAATIVEFARERGADLIMMPTAGAGPFRRLLLGSVTAKVLHDSGTPVWTGVHADEMAAHPAGKWQRALCAVEDDPRDLPLLHWAAEFAHDQKLEVRLVHAVRGPEECEGNASFREFLFNNAQERIGKLQAQAGTNFEVCLRLGEAGHAVHQAAFGHSADIVIIGRGVSQKAFGRFRSHAYEIIREAPCPVISV